MDKKVKIHINGANEAPKLFNDDSVYPVVSIDYNYETVTDVSCGSHKLLVEYIDEDNNKSTIIGFDKKG